MKAMVALEVGVLRLLAAPGASTPAWTRRVDPIPGLRRDVLFACTADEEAGGWNGAGLAGRPPARDDPRGRRPQRGRRHARSRSAGAGSTRSWSPRRATRSYRIRVRGTWGHGSMPRDDNALVRAAQVVTRIAVPGEPRPTPVMRRLLAEVGAALPPDQAALMAAIVDDDPRRVGGRDPRRLRPGLRRDARRAAARHVQPRRSCTRASSTT